MKNNEIDEVFGKKWELLPKRAQLNRWPRTLGINFYKFPDTKFCRARYSNAHKLACAQKIYISVIK